VVDTVGVRVGAWVVGASVVAAMVCGGTGDAVVDNVAHSNEKGREERDISVNAALRRGTVSSHDDMSLICTTSDVSVHSKLGTCETFAISAKRRIMALRLSRAPSVRSQFALRNCPATLSSVAQLIDNNEAPGGMHGASSELSTAT
jgi:hypothetical protein